MNIINFIFNIEGKVLIYSKKNYSIILLHFIKMKITWEIIILKKIVYKFLKQPNRFLLWVRILVGLNSRQGMFGYPLLFLRGNPPGHFWNYLLSMLTRFVSGQFRYCEFLSDFISYLYLTLANQKSAPAATSRIVIRP